MALSGRVRAGSGLAGDQGSGQARDLRFAGACLACGAGAQRAMLGGAARRLSRLEGPAIAALLVAAVVIEGRGFPSTRPTPRPSRGSSVPPSVASCPRPSSSTCRPSRPRQPTLPAVVDRRLPGDRQRALEPESRLHEAPDRAGGAVPRPAHGRIPVTARCEQRGPARQPRQRHALGGGRASPGRRARGHAPGSGRPGRLRDPLAERGQAGPGARLRGSRDAPSNGAPAARGRRGQGQRHQGERRWVLVEGNDRVPRHAGPDNRDRGPGEQRGDGRPHVLVRNRGVASVQKAIAATTAAGRATASQPLWTPSTVSTVCSRLPEPS